MENKTKHLSPAIWFNIILVAAFSVGYLSWAKSNDAWPYDNEILPFYRHTSPGVPVTLEGKIICLPHRDRKLATKECTLGLQAENNNNYLLSGATSSKTTFSIGSQYRISGQLIKNPSTRYNSVGTIEIK